jgi:hypothetical protein
VGWSVGPGQLTPEILGRCLAEPGAAALKRPKSSEKRLRQLPMMLAGADHPHEGAGHLVVIDQGR